jgi:hypothetical protein
MKLAVLACLLVSAVGVGVAASPPRYVSRTIEGRAIRLPVPDGFTPACEENDSIRERFARMAGSNLLLTCLFESDDYAALMGGQTAATSPLVVLGSINGPAGRLTADEFKRSIEMAHAKMGDIVEDPAGRRKSQAQLDAADENMSGSGEKFQRQLLGAHMLGFFDSTETSYSFLQTSAVNLTVGTETQLRTEIQAITSLWVEGHLLVLFVSDERDSEEARKKVRDITLRWLAEYRRANSRRP